MTAECTDSYGNPIVVGTRTAAYADETYQSPAGVVVEIYHEQEGTFVVVRLDGPDSDGATTQHARVEYHGYKGYDYPGVCEEVEVDLSQRQPENAPPPQASPPPAVGFTAYYDGEE